ncbi:MAG TPA: crosslink repair DNA glycosylase YcaQ family protein [Pseudonocardiaceae bacterium]|nr:crosslink repair DNA glycosylase YcaQ family protein [Pseudonocardiaceae bacterium]
MVSTAVRVDRQQVLAYRIAANELQRAATRPADLAVTALGVQDTPAGTARLAIAARTTADLADDRLALVWSTRGAPHLHRRADLSAVAAALWPLSDADARSRIASSKIREGATLGLAAFTAAATAMGHVVTRPMAKGLVSGAVTARIPESLTFWCQPCGSRHLSGALFQQIGLAGGTELVPDSPATTLAPIKGWSGPPAEARGTAELARTYLRLLGPATDTETAAFIGTTRTQLRAVWPDGLTEVLVDGRSCWLPEDCVPALLDPAAPPDVRLLPAGDPFLQARDRQLLVPDKARHGEVWKVLGNPGVLLVDGDIAGTWRARLAGKRTLDVRVTAFDPLPRATRRVLTDEAARMATVRGVADVRVNVAD